MRIGKLGNQGFSMIELLVVLLIIGILAAVAAPLFLSNTDRARASEAVTGLGTIRSAERIYKAQKNGFSTDGVIYTTGAASEVGALIGVDLSGAKYFSNSSYAFQKGAGFSNGDSAVDFVIGANGATAAGAAQLAGQNKAMIANGGTGARNYTEVANIKVEMDNSGKILYTTDGANWNEY